MSANHTPAPWRIGDAGRTVFGPKTEHPAPVIVAGLQPATPRVSADERKANAALIAAAPELLAALELIASKEVNFPAGTHRDAFKRCKEIALAAIAKVQVAA